MTNLDVSGHDNTTVVGRVSFETNFTCSDHILIAVDRLRTFYYFTQYVFLALGVPGNVLSAIVWLRRRVIGKSTFAIYLAALAIDDLALQLIWRTFNDSVFRMSTEYMDLYSSELHRGNRNSI